MFERVLRLKNFMLTDFGKEELKGGHQFISDFLYCLPN